jgi:hypothetical protein
MISIEQAYRDNQKLIKAISRSVAKKYFQDPKEVEAEANLAFCEIYSRYKKAKGPFENFLRYSLCRKLNSICKNSYRTSLVEIPTDPGYFQASMVCKDRLNSFPEIILKGKEKEMYECIISNKLPRRITKRSLMNYFTNEGWKRKEIQGAFLTFEEVVKAEVVMA